MATQIITNLSRIWVQYLARDGTTYRVTMRAAYLHVFTGTYFYVEADESFPVLAARPAQLLIASSIGSNLLRRHIPYCWSNADPSVLPGTIVVDNLTWTVTGFRPERRWGLSVGYPS
jgi:hypothetical protein